jgi:hypothetical protein
MASQRTILILAIPFMIIGFLLSGAPTLMSTYPPTKAWADGPMKLVATPQFETKKVRRCRRCPRYMWWPGLTSFSNQTDIFTSGATHMALLHNSILRGYNSIIHQAPVVLDHDKANFVGYSLAWYRFVKSHHDDEEETLFTKIEELLKDKDVFAETHKEHGGSPKNGRKVRRKS